MTREELDNDMIESIEMWLHEIEPKWVEKELAWLDELRTRLIEEEVPNDLDFEQELYNRFGQIKDFTLGMRIGQYFYELGCHRTAEKYDEIEYNRQREEESVPNDLDEAAIKYADTIATDAIDHDFHKMSFISGAEWQYQKDRTEFAKLKAKEWSDGYDEGIEKGKEQMMDEWLKDRDGCFWDGVNEGKKAMEEQMMKGARNHFVYNILSGNDMKKMIEIYNDEADCRPGDVVRVIIVKED